MSPKEKSRNKKESSSWDSNPNPITPSSLTLDDLLSQGNVKSIADADLFREENIPEKEFVEQTPTNSKKPVVASFITRALIWLFIGQAGLITTAYIFFIGLSLDDPDMLTLVTQTVLSGMEKIIPVTTTLLGVVIGYYFREISNSEGQDSKR